MIPFFPRRLKDEGGMEVGTTKGWRLLHREIRTLRWPT